MYTNSILKLTPLDAQLLNDETAYQWNKKIKYLKYISGNQLKVTASCVKIYCLCRLYQLILYMLILLLFFTNNFIYSLIVIFSILTAFSYCSLLKNV